MTDVITFGRIGAATQHTLRTGAGISFSSIACIAQTTCELAGWNVDDSIAYGSWANGRLGQVHEVPLPIGSGSGDAAPQIACTGTWCELAMNPNPPSMLTLNDEQAYLITLHDERVVSERWLKGYEFDSISCSSTGCYIGLTQTTTNRGYVAQLTHGRLGTLNPSVLPGPRIACEGATCVGVSGNKIAVYHHGIQQSLIGTRGVQAYEGVGIGPGLSYAAVGARYHRAGSILTTGTA